jgi:CheY-like chemotaxis protein
MDIGAWYGEAGSDGGGSTTERAPGIRILLVDDHSDTLLVIRAVLEQRGYTVLSAATLAEARRQAEQGFDLLLCDIDLPDGTGIELLEWLSHERPVRAIAMSGYGRAEDVERSVSAGFSRHLIKPFPTDRLIEAIMLTLA